jgi:hypothetical protein
MPLPSASTSWTTVPDLPTAFLASGSVFGPGAGAVVVVGPVVGVRDVVGGGAVGGGAVCVGVAAVVGAGIVGTVPVCGFGFGLGFGLGGQRFAGLASAAVRANS